MVNSMFTMKIKIVGSYDNEADARSFVNAQQKNTLVSADEEVVVEKRYENCRRRTYFT
jgi:hypothetical protein